MLAAVGVAMANDATVFRGMIEVVNCRCSPPTSSAPWFDERVAPFVGRAPTPLPGPDREAALVAGLV